MDAGGSLTCPVCGQARTFDGQTHYCRKKTPLILVDLDWTLARLGDREWYEFDKCDRDTVIEEVDVAVKAIANHFRWSVGFLTGRPLSCRSFTINWLTRHGWAANGFGSRQPFSNLWMRADDDRRPGDIFKRDVLKTKILPTYDVKLVFEDHGDTVTMMRSLGLTVWDVAGTVHAPFVEERPDAAVQGVPDVRQ